MLANERIDNTSSLPEEQLVLELPLGVQLDELQQGLPSRIGCRPANPLHKQLPDAPVQTRTNDLGRRRYDPPMHQGWQVRNLRRWITMELLQQGHMNTSWIFALTRRRRR